jgi:hypothetical protein
MSDNIDDKPIESLRRSGSGVRERILTQIGQVLIDEMNKKQIRINELRSYLIEDKMILYLCCRFFGISIIRMREYYPILVERLRYEAEQLALKQKEKKALEEQKQLEEKNKQEELKKKEEVKQEVKPP